MRFQIDLKEIIPEIVSFLKDKLGSNFEVVVDFYNLWAEKYDIAILRNRDIIALIEVKSAVSLLKSHPFLYDTYDLKRRTSAAKYYVITDGDDYCVYSSNGLEPTCVTGEEFVKRIIQGYPMSMVEPENKDIAKIVADSAVKHKLQLVANFIRKSVVFKCDPESATISFVSDQIEDSFFKKLLPRNREIDRMCRYTTMDSAFLLLKNLRQNMCNVLCMNDKSEGIYAEKRVFGRILNIYERTFAESDHCYIVSLLDARKEDDLTMWRLYGNDAKGVCITYDRNPATKENFYMARVSYGRLIDGREVHYELDFLRDILRHNYGDGWRLRFNRWGIWKHFFKSYLFSDEREIRLLYYDKNNDREPFEWIKNEQSQIVTKMQLFTIEEFPLRITRMIVGPKSPEPSLISRQLQLLSLAQHVNIEIIPSRIDIYR